jgi:hypothetical protein
MLQDLRRERWQRLDVCQWIAFLDLWQQTIVPDGVEQLMLITPRVALKQRFAVFAITDA